MSQTEITQLNNWKVINTSSISHGFEVNFKTQKVRAIDYTFDPPKESNIFHVDFERIEDIYSSRFYKYCLRFFNIQLIPDNLEKKAAKNQLLYAFDDLVSTIQEFLQQQQNEEQNAISSLELQEQIEETHFAEEMKELRRSGKIIKFLEETFEKSLVNEKVNQFVGYCATLIGDSILLQGESSAGKTAIAKNILKCLPAIDVLRIGHSDPAALKHALINASERKRPYKYLFLQEESALSEHEQLPVRNLSKDDEGIIINLSVKGDPDSNRFATSQQFQLPPMAIISTTTTIDMNIQDLNRRWILNPKISEEQNIAVIDRLLFEVKFEAVAKKQVEELEERFAKIRVLTRQVQAENFEVVIPFLSFELVNIPTKETRIRRDFQRLCNFIKVITRINAPNRPVFEEDGITYVVSSLTDLELAIDYISESFKTSVSGLDKTSTAILKILEELREENSTETYFTTTEITERFNQENDLCSQRWINELLNKVLLPKGYVYKDKGQKNANVWRLSNKSPCELSFKNNYEQKAREVFEDWLQQIPASSREQLEKHPKIGALLLSREQNSVESQSKVENFQLKKNTESFVSEKKLTERLSSSNLNLKQEMKEVVSREKRVLEDDSVVKEIVNCLSELEQETNGKPVFLGTIVEKMHKQGIKQLVVEQTLKHLRQEGIVFCPLLEHYKLV
ncbi:MAG: hypothetical protein ACTSVS_09325 [Candidatus Heimdallarchaeota archaeon]